MEKQLYIKERVKSDLNIALNEKQVEQLYKYYEMIIEKNKVMNLTAITDFEEFVVKHYVDSLSVVKAIDLKNKSIDLIDIGTGAGFPGVPLKILFPDMKVTLFDSLQKRLAFLDDVINELKLEKTYTVHGRAEEFGRKLDYREKYDIVVSRAVAELSTLCELTLPFCKVGGCFIAYKGGKADEEIKNAEYAIKELGGKTGNIVKYDYSINGISNERFLIEINKKKPTASKYPRGGGKPFKAPISLA